MSVGHKKKMATVNTLTKIDGLSGFLNLSNIKIDGFQLEFPGQHVGDFGEFTCLNIVEFTHLNIY